MAIPTLQDKKLTWKERYWMRRRAGLRGQGDPIKPVFIPKGQAVTKVLPDGTEKEVPNAEGSHMVQTKRGMQFLNRKQHRRKLKDRDYTTPKYEYITTKRTDNQGNPDYFKGHSGQTPMPPSKDGTWIPKWRRNLPKEWEHPEPTQPPRLSNHTRMRIRMETKEAERNRRALAKEREEQDV